MLNEAPEDVLANPLHNTTSLFLFLSQYIVWKEFIIKCWHASIAYKTDNDCVVDGWYKVLLLLLLFAFSVF